MDRLNRIIFALIVLTMLTGCGAENATSDLANGSIVPGGKGYQIFNEKSGGLCLTEGEIKIHDMRVTPPKVYVQKVGALKPCISNGKMLPGLFLKTNWKIWSGEDRVAFQIFLKDQDVTCLADGGAGHRADTSWHNCGIGLDLPGNKKVNGTNWIVQRKSNLLGRIVSLAPGPTKTSPQRCLEADANKRVVLVDCSEASYQWRFGALPF